MIKPWIFTFKQSGDLDQFIQSKGFPEQQLLGQAALASYYQLQLDGFLPTTGPLWFLCGSGNNGGDALALAWYLQSQSLLLQNPSAQIRIFMHPQGPQTKLNQFYFQRCQESGILIHSFQDFCDQEEKKIFPDTLMVDGLLGIKTKGEMREPYLSVLKKLKKMRESSTFSLISLDLPTGLSEDGLSHKHMVPPDRVYSFGVHKLSVTLCPQISSSQVNLLPMGFGSEHIQQFSDGNASSFPIPLLWRPLKDSSLSSFFKKEKTHHKYQAGSGLIIGGGPGMEGALLLAAHSYFAAGGGIVWGLCPYNESRSKLLQGGPGVLYRDMEEQNLNLEELLPRIKGALIGPGLGPLESPAIKATFERIMEQLIRHHQENPDFYFVFDAGLLTQHSSYLSHFQGSHVLLTPHRGELKKLGFQFHGLADELPALREFVMEKMKSWVLVKDAVSILCGPQGECFVWNEPSPHLAVAGSGDVLGGILLAAFTRIRQQSFSLPQLIHACLDLHHRANGKRVHPNAKDLIDGVDGLLLSLN